MLTLFSILFIFSIFSTATTESNVQAMFVFGDSIVEAGNNVFLDTAAKCNYFPYGVDFPSGVTGRCTNGKTPADLLGLLLGLPHLLPVFYDPQTRGSSILAGVNYASDGAGILDSTRQSQHVISLSHQIANFGETTLPDLKSQLNGSFALSSYLSQSIFFFFIGGGDYMANCTTSSGVAAECDLQSLTELLIRNYTNLLTRAYDFGARKFVVFNLPQAGCAPFFKRQNNGSCVDLLNEGSTLFNNALRPALENLSEDLPGFSFVYINTSGIINEIINDPTTYGLKVTNGSCCFADPDGIRPLCVEGTEPCPDRSIYAYYDGSHPTEELYMHLSTKAYSSDLQTEAYPFNVEVLANLNISLMLIGAPSFHTRDH
ncbi:GDSL esterase/lipase At1g71691-like isoform X4 [Nymphaea colorata]|nr:GDSL esterase/lipase At1g71691-like isoform X3 [Nymphaea colorata]XP_049934337.1 GDSL esterase/lipase At1g71691-like isoform X4 [Nymphaea colorata]